MAIIGYSESLAWRAQQNLACDASCESSVWEEASTWVALLPTLYITARGAIQSDSGPAAFRFTAMEADTLGYKAAKVAFSLVILLLLSSRFSSILAACKRSKLLLLLPAIALVSAFWSQNPRHTVVDALNLLLTTLFAVYLYVRYPGRRLISFLTFAALVSLALCVLSVTVFRDIGVNSYANDAWRGIFGHKNSCAAACVLFLAVGLTVRTQGLSEQVIRGSVVFLSLVFIAMSDSMQGWLLAALAIALIYGLRLVARIRSLDRLLFLLVLSVPLSLGVYFVESNYTRLVSVIGKDPTLTQRTIIWEQALLAISKHPIMGYGYSAFWAGLNGESMQAVLVTKWMEFQAQDGYLDVLLGLGLVGLIPLVLVIVRALVQGAAAIEHGRQDDVLLLAIALLPLILLENIGESLLLVPLGIPWLYALIAFQILGRPDRHEEEV